MGVRADSVAYNDVLTAVRWVARLHPNKRSGGRAEDVRPLAYKAAARILWPEPDLAVDVIEHRLRDEVVDVVQLLAASHELRPLERDVVIVHVRDMEMVATESGPDPWRLRQPNGVRNRNTKERRASILVATNGEYTERTLKSKVEDPAFRMVVAAMLNARRSSPDDGVLHLERAASGAAESGGQAPLALPSFQAASDDLTEDSLNELGRSTVHHMFRELFPDATRIVYKALTPGMSGASVFRVTPHRGQRQRTCVVKIGLAADTQAELDAWEQYVKPFMASKHIPAKQNDKILGDVGGIAYEFLATETLNQRLLALTGQQHYGQIERLLTEVFEIVKDAWHGERTMVERFLTVEDYTLTEGDLSAFEAMCADLPPAVALPQTQVANVRKVWSSAAVLPTSHAIAICHGDLFGENVLIDEDDDLGLIDFSHTREQHYLRDHITMEGDLTLRLLQADGAGPDAASGLISRLIGATTAGGDAPFLVPPALDGDPPAVLASIAAVRAIRTAAWARMENDAAELAGYRVGLIRRLVRTSARLENRLSDVQRWVGLHLAVAHATELVSALLPPPLTTRDDQAAVEEIATRPRVRHTPLTKQHARNFTEKLVLARSRPTPSFLLIGGVYVDVILSPIEDTLLRAEEWSNLEEVKIRLGGSCLQVGARLYDAYDVQASLFSATGGAMDPLSQEAHNLLARQGWIARKHVEPVPGIAAAVSVHLHQADGMFKTVFTHKGALAYLDWHRLESELLLEHVSGGVLYIGGYFRTNLHNGLHDALQRHGMQQLVVLDHGQLVPEVESQLQVSYLKHAFDRGEIDVYICTHAEFQALADHPERAKRSPTPSARDAPASGPPLEQLAKLAGRLPLPPVTVVRDPAWLDPPTAVVITPGSPPQLATVTIPAGHALPWQTLGSDNAFNAGFLYGLVTGDPDAGSEAATLEAVQEGLRIWTAGVT